MRVRGCDLTAREDVSTAAYNIFALQCIQRLHCVLAHATMASQQPENTMRHTYTVLAIARRHPALFSWLLARKAH